MFLGRVVGPGEPLWLEEDRAWALALAQVEAEQCPGCGQPLAETTDPGAQYAYQAKITRCHACAAVAREGRDFAEHGETEGLLVQAVDTRKRGGAHGW